jgi:hypothetical protein
MIRLRATGDRTDAADADADGVSGLRIAVAGGHFATDGMPEAMRR